MIWLFAHENCKKSEKDIGIIRWISLWNGFCMKTAQLSSTEPELTTFTGFQMEKGMHMESSGFNLIDDHIIQFSTHFSDVYSLEHTAYLTSAEVATAFFQSTLGENKKVYVDMSLEIPS